MRNRGTAPRVIIRTQAAHDRRLAVLFPWKRTVFEFEMPLAP